MMSDEASFNLLWAIPFVGIILSIALFPLFAKKFWLKHFGKIAFFWSIALIIPLFLFQGWDFTTYKITHEILHHYLPFIILIFSLYTISGGIAIESSLRGRPEINTLLLLFGSLLSSFIGTTGSAMLLIRPFISMNAHRKNKVHLIIFFIFLVANIGGSLSPIGDPPLFLGFLNGVPFEWPIKKLFLPFLMVWSPVLILFYIADHYYFKKEKKDLPAPPSRSSCVIHVRGVLNFCLILLVSGSIIFSGTWDPGIHFSILGVKLPLQDLARDVILLGLAWLSWRYTNKQNRKINGFDWFPVIEVAKLFAGIFITIIPIITMLEMGDAGPLGIFTRAVNEGGQPNNFLYFWVTGWLSAFLDNAPTYLVFFHTAGGDAAHLIGPLEKTLIAISTGAVFMGAMTYIGNAPNFMVKAIAEEYKIDMPGFFGYLGWSILILLPIFLPVTWFLFK